MNNEEREDNRTYRVVINHEEQYSIWPADRENALGWFDAGRQGTKEECLDYIKDVWTDMRPLSLRRQMAQMSHKNTKGKKMKRLTILCVSLLATSITIMQIGIGKTQSGTEDILQKTFPVSGGGMLLLDAAIGTVDVRPTSTDTVTVRVIPQIKTDSAEERQRLLANLVVDATQQQNDVIVTAKFRRETPDDERRQVRLHFEISVPQTFNLDVNTVGAVTTGDIRGNVRVATAGGSIALGNIEGTLTVDSQGGSVTAGGIMDIQAETSGGSFKAYLSQQPRSDSKISTSGGRIEMRVAQTVGVELDAVTTTGRVTTDNPALTHPHEKQNVLQTAINGGGPKLVLRAADGSIRVGMSSEEHRRHGSLDHLEQNWR